MTSNNHALEELENQQQQLAEIDQLLLASPGDPSLLSLKADLLELIAVTTAQVLPENEPATTDLGTKVEITTDGLRENEVDNSTEDQEDTNDDGEAQISGWSNVKSEKHGTKRALEQDTTTPKEAPGDSVEDKTPDETGESLEQERPQKKKKSSVPKEFVIPPHLQPNEKDSKAEANRKKRALKALKNQWRAQKKELEVNQKQKSWQDFQKKKKPGTSSGSMFSTSTDSTKVGVVGGRNITEFVSRKRHK